MVVFSGTVTERGGMKTKEESGDENTSTSEAEWSPLSYVDQGGLLAGGIAHQINNALQIIVGHAELLAEGLAGPKAQKASADTIRRTGRKTAELITKLLRFARARPRRVAVVDIGDLVSDSVPHLKSQLPHNVELRTQSDSGEGSTLVDPHEIELLLWTLTTNACDAMPRGGTITIRTSTVNADRLSPRTDGVGDTSKSVLLSVTDTGIGIDPDVQDHLYEPFFTTNPDRIGLGLAVVYEIVQRSGGLIRVDTAVGRGTTFSVSLPSVAAGERPVKKLRTEAGPPLSASVQKLVHRAVMPGGNETILVVEDSPAILELCVSLLRTLGYNVLEATRGDEALRIAKTQSGEIHMVLSDVVMPGMNGLEVAARLRAIRPDLKVLYMSGYRSDAVTERLEHEPGSEFIEKPFDLNSLAVKIRILIDRNAKDSTSR